MSSATAGRQLYEAAKVMYQTEKYQKRGEFGELLLHVVMRQFYDTIPAISKLFLKSAVNETVKGFDAVHVAISGVDLDLWLGEVKFYEDAGQAIRDVVAELTDHFQEDYLRNEFLLIANKLDPSMPVYDKLKELLAPQTSLDKIFKRIHVPVLVTYESRAIANHNAITAEFQAELAKELEVLHDAFSAKSLPGKVIIHFVLVPLHQKPDLVKALDEKLKKLQDL